MSHAVLSPSSASRWLNCTPSAQLEAKEPYSVSEYADEGTLAHRLCELLINYRLGRILEKAYKKELKTIETHKHYSGEMLDFCDGFAVYVLELFNSLKGAHLFTEEKVSLAKWVPDGFGTVDIKIIASKVLHIVDYKHGKGVPVFADNNSQLKLYALGVYEELTHLFDIDTVSMTIYQPRIENVSTYTISAAELLTWGENELKPRAKIAFEGGGDFVPGDHCRFCRVKGKCKALATFNLELAKKAFAEPTLLSPEEISEILQKEKFFSDWLAAVSEYAYTAALEGTQWPGMKLVEGRSNRAYIDEVQVAKTLAGAGLAEADIFNKKLKGITDMTKTLGKNDFERLLSDLVHKPPGKPVLVPESDKRPAFSSLDRAKDAFANE